jgi:hypothetical protein
MILPRKCIVQYQSEKFCIRIFATSLFLYFTCKSIRELVLVTNCIYCVLSAFNDNRLVLNHLFISSRIMERIIFIFIYLSNILYFHSGVEIREYGRRDLSCWPRGTLYPQKLALTSPTSGGDSVGIVCSRTQVTEFMFFITFTFAFHFSRAHIHVSAYLLNQFQQVLQESS